MNRFFLTMTAGLLVFSQSGVVSAQGVSAAAMSEARARLVCGTGTVVSALYLPGGALQVTCARPPVEAASTVLQGTGLSAPAAVGLLVGVAILTVVTGSGGSNSTTTSDSE